MKNKNTILLCTLAVLALAGFSILTLLYFGVLHINHIDRERYPIIGVDVSSHQGEINWAELSSCDIQFAFIKATEGSSFIDPCFAYNWEEASKTDLRIGAYHFFSFESSGLDQAKLFCKTVRKVEGMLPPVVDVEYYGDFDSLNSTDLSRIQTELRDFINYIKSEYHVEPILYVTQKSYAEIIRDAFQDCHIWYRSVYSRVPRHIPWTFWQFSNRHTLNGYAGKERYIDMNVFCGSAEAFSAFP